MSLATILWTLIGGTVIGLTGKLLVLSTEGRPPVYRNR